MNDDTKTTEREDAYGRTGTPQQCLACDGTGRANDDTCGTCGGEGFVCWWGAVRNQEKECAKHTHSLMQRLERLPYQWRGMSPSAVCAGSPAQVLFCVTDAQKDIVAALDEIERLRKALTSIRKFLENPCWGKGNYMDGSDLYRDRDSALDEIKYAFEELT